MTTQSERVLILARRAGVLRPRDLDAHGIPREVLRRLEARGLLRRPSRGLYIPSGADVTEQHSLAQAGKRVPHGIVCLLSALRFHELTTQAPFEVWMAINVAARSPKSDHLPLRIVRMSGASIRTGVESHSVEGVPVRVFSAAKTVVDCFKFRNKIGLDVALDALRDYRRRKRKSSDELWRLATICRVARVMRPYLEAL